MIRCFAGRLDTVVTGDATAGCRGVIHEDAGVPRRGIVAIGAATGGCDMIGRF